MATKPRDVFAATPPRRTRVFIWGAIAVGLSIIVAAAAANYAYQRDADVKKAKETAISGPPCPELTEAEYVAKGYKPKNAFSFGGVELFRQSGHAECDEIASTPGLKLGRYQVCQFTSPQALKVKAPAGTFYFLPGIGNPATVVVENGKPRCVVASNFKLN